MRAVHRITNSLVQEWIELFQRKNEDYNSDPMPGFPEGFENADVLGIQGQFAEIWRKIWKLKKSMWDGQQLGAEQPREILMDLIGHAFLAIDMIDRQELVQAEKFAAVKAKLQTGGETFKNVPTGMDGVTLAPDEAPRAACGLICTQGHTYTGSCMLRRNAGRKDI